MARLRFFTAGESHGEMLVGILDGVPAGLSLIAERDIDPILRDRQSGYGRGRRQQIESDRARIVAGVRFGVTTGAPIALLVENKDWMHWRERMSVLPDDAETRRVTIPRPGHADLAGGLKYGHESDLRNVLERASARETTMRVALGSIAKRILGEVGIDSIGFVRSIGTTEASPASDPFLERDVLRSSALRVFDAEIEAEMIAAIDEARQAGDTLGGVVECIVKNVPVGIGSHVQSDRKLDAAIAQAVMSVQAVKAVEIGAGTAASSAYGSEVHDPIFLSGNRIMRESNNAGGIEGGMSNGEPIVIRAHMKPISTLMQPLESFDLDTNTMTEAHIERSDVCAVPALSVILDAVVAHTVADLLLDTFGGDTMDELTRRVARRRAKLERRPV